MISFKNLGYKGYLGNQMFQYAAARSVALREDVPLHLDLSWFGTDPARQFALSHFNIEASTSADTQVSKNSLLARVGRRIKRSVGMPEYGLRVFTEKSFRYDPTIQNAHAPVYLDGHFQSEKYFSPMHQQISSDFTIRNEPHQNTKDILSKIIATDSICIHIRRGDYVSNPQANAYHGTCSFDYYHAGLDIVCRGLKRPHCFLFSDEPTWVRDNFHLDLPVTVVDIHSAQEAHEDLRLMSACQRFVIANSSLSWWGAWLASGSDKCVVAPKRWFNGGCHDTCDLIPDGWVQV